MDVLTANSLVGKAIGAALQQLGHPPPVVAVVYVSFVPSVDGGVEYGPGSVTVGKEAPTGELMAMASRVLLDPKGKPIIEQVPEAGEGS